MKPHPLRAVRAFAGLFLAALALGAGAGCKDEVCSQMLECCELSAEVEGIGSACGELAQDVRDPSTCRTILKTVRFVYDDKGLEAPAACLPEGEETP